MRAGIVKGLYDARMFQPESFDLICAFQVFDHVPAPAELLAECHRILRPGGLVLALNHDVESLSARLLGSSARLAAVAVLNNKDQRETGQRRQDNRPF